MILNFPERLGGICQNLLRSSQSARAVDGRIYWKALPRFEWGLYTAIAVLGSMIYGASLGPYVDGVSPASAAWRLTIAAAAGWLFFGPCLILWSGKTCWTCAHLCMTTMVHGEMLLVLGALINAGLWGVGVSASFFGWWNVSLVGLTNIVMMISVTVQMRSLGVAWFKPIFLWLGVLNGVGLLVWNLMNG